MRYFYDRESDSLYLSLVERKKYNDSLEAAPGVVLDFDSAGRLIGIDLEHASKTVDVSDLALHEEPGREESKSTKVDGARLKREREDLGLSQADLGRELSVSSNTIARWERGELKIEHSSMLSLALEALRNRKPVAKRRIAGLVARGPVSRKSKSARMSSSKKHRRD